MKCNKCDKEVEKDAKFCTHCGGEIGQAANFKKTEKITGWVAVFGAVLIITVLTTAWYAITDNTYLFDGTLQIANQYARGLSTVSWYEFISVIILSILGIYTVFLFLKKRREIKKFFFIFAGGLLVYSLIDYLLLDMITGSSYELQTALDESKIEALDVVFRNIGFLVIWGLYLIRSKRIKKIFVN